jgi:hypothetical protein
VGLSCSFVEPEEKFNASSLLLNSCHFDNCRHPCKRCQEKSQNLETHALIDTKRGTKQHKFVALTVCEVYSNSWKFLVGLRKREMKPKFENEAVEIL